MKCPVCDAVLVMTVREGVEIDYCPKCRGLWLDRGELDKLIAVAQADRGPPAASRGARSLDDSDDSSDYDSDHRRAQNHGRPPYPKKRESFWSNLFDFD